jgi:hypothetical protein
MDGGSFLGMADSSVVIDDLDIQRVAILPAEVHTELVVDADAVGRRGCLSGPPAACGAARAGGAVLCPLEVVASVAYSEANGCYR